MHSMLLLTARAGGSPLVAMSQGPIEGTING
jgi:hypothetical protein